MSLAFIQTSLSALVIILTYIALRRLTNKARDPVVVPALLPWVGNLLEFSLSPIIFLEDCRRRYGDTYKFQICGRQVVVVSHPAGISSLYQDVNKAFSTFELHSQVANILTGTKDPAQIIDMLERKLYRIVALNLSPSMSITHGKEISRMLVAELNAMTCHHLPFTLNLYDFITRPLYMAGCHFLFGSTFPCAETFADFRMVELKFSKLGTPLMASLPFFVPEGIRARERLCSHVCAYIQPWWDSNGSHGLPGISDLMLQSLQAMKESKLSKADATALNILVAFGFHSNTWYTLFWLMVQLIQDDGLMEKIRSEINLNNPQLVDPDDNSGEGLYPILNSVIEETLRWAGRSSPVRLAEKDTGLTQDGKFIPVRKGEYIIADVRALHFDPQGYPDAENFKFDRYITSATSGGSPPSKPQAWGGGKHGCLGRHLAKYEIREFVIICLQLYDIKGVFNDATKRELPSLRTKDLWFGSPKAAEDLFVTITKRKEFKP